VLISSNTSETEIVKRSKEQKQMLQMSEDDIAEGRLISQEEIDKRNLEWLNTM
jgi:hypothetical protein